MSMETPTVDFENQDTNPDKLNQNNENQDTGSENPDTLYKESLDRANQIAEAVISTTVNELSRLPPDKMEEAICWDLWNVVAEEITGKFPKKMNIMPEFSTGGRIDRNILNDTWKEMLDKLWTWIYNITKGLCIERQGEFVRVLLGEGGIILDNDVPRPATSEEWEKLYAEYGPAIEKRFEETGMEDKIDAMDEELFGKYEVVFWELAKELEGEYKGKDVYRPSNEITMISQ